MTTSTTATAPISGLLSLVAGTLEPTTAPPPAPGTAAPAPALDLPAVLGQLAGAWLAVKDDGQGWMLLQFAPSTGDGEAAEVPAPVATVTPPTTRGDHGARARRVHTALTDREREVLRLVSTGATNGAIAARLFISPKTASVHVSRILTKLDAATRTEAAALAHASGLVQPWEAVVA
jgi:DNA-binding CsgD family transcriptional regulator